MTDLGMPRYAALSGGRLVVSSPSRRVIKYRVDDHNDDIGEI